MNVTQHERSGEDADAAILVILPAYCEEASLAAVLDDLAATLPDVDVLVIDDGSPDRTAEIAASRSVHVVRHPFNLGYGCALETGYLFGRRGAYKAVVQMDADGQHEARYVKLLAAPVLAGQADIVVGSRFVETVEPRQTYAMGPLKRLGKSWFRFLLRRLGGPRLTDPTSGFQALSPRVLDA
jgi:glycosyltransferase involved in cell wall biosynthesis